MTRFFDKIDGLTDGAVREIMGRIPDGHPDRREAFREVLVGGRRLKALFAPSKLSTEQAEPELTLANLGLMTDEEIVSAFMAEDDMTKAEFELMVDAENGLTATRFRALLKEADAKARQADAKAEQVKREIARQTFLSRIWTDEEALKWMLEAMRFQGPEEMDKLVGEGTVQDMVNKNRLLVSEAKVLGRCLVTDETTARRLSQKTRKDKKWTDGKQVPYFGFEEARRRLEDGSRQRAAVEQKALEDLAGCQTTQDFANLLAEMDAIMASSAANRASWQDKVRRGVIMGRFLDARREVSGKFLDDLHQNYGVEDIANLRERVAGVESELEAKGDAAAPEAVMEEIRWRLRMLEKHMDHLSRQADNSNVVQFRQGTHRAGKSSRARTETEEKVRRARQILNGINYDGLPESRKTKFGGQCLLLSELSDEQLLQEAERLKVAGKKPKAAKSEGKKANGGKK